MRVSAKAINTLCFIALAIGLAGCEVVDLDAAGNPIIPMSTEAASQLMNMEPAAIAEQLWPTVVAEYRDQAVAMGSLDLSGNFNAFVRTEAVVSEFSESILGKALVVNADSVSIPLQLGPVVKGNAVRDSLTFVKFDQFRNQVQFAQFSKELNRRAVAELASPDLSWVDQTVDLVAAITVANGQVVSAVPLELERR